MLTPLESRPPLSILHWPYLPTDVVVRVLWQKRFRLLGIGVVFTVAGVVVAWLIKPEFRSIVRIMPEMNNGSGDMLKRLASVAGFSSVDFADTDDIDAVRPDLYPNVLQSTPFFLYLIEQPVITTDGQPKTVGQLLLPNDKGRSLLQQLWVTIADPSTLPAKSSPAGAVRLSAWQQEVAEEISERVSAKLDTRSGIITITANMPDANVAATVAQLAMTYLTQYVTNYRTEKARQDLRFYNKHLGEAQKRYHTAQYNVFHYNDTHKSMVIQTATMDRHRMESELTIAQTVYIELSRQFEQARLKVQARTPVFKVLEPPNVPLKRTSPKRMILVLLFAIVGLFVGVLGILTKQTDVVGRLRAMVATERMST